MKLWVSWPMILHMLEIEDVQKNTKSKINHSQSKSYIGSKEAATLEFFLNIAEFSMNSANSGNLKITEA